MRRAGLVFASLAAAGLGLYLWPALTGPPVLWSDSELDLRWAREGVGITKAPSGPDLDVIHPVKPGYLLYLRAAGSAFPFLSRERSIVVTQSLLLWLSIVGTSWMTARRRGLAAGAAVCAALFLFLPLRDAASNVMSEAISAVFLIPLAFAALEPPRSIRGTLVAGVAAAALFWVRPNVGAIAALAILGSWIAFRRFRFAAAFGGITVALTLALWLVTSPVAGPDSSRGMRDAILTGSAEYLWAPSQGVPSGRGTSHDTRLALARSNWKAVLDATPADRAREIRWRALHSLLGLEFYDARWSGVYRSLDHVGRLLAPWLVLAAIAGAIAGRKTSRETAVVAGLLLAGAVLQSLALGAIPRFSVPLIPGLLLVGAAAAFGPRDGRTPGRALAVWVLLAGLLAIHPEVASWEWGQIERAGVTLEQRVPRDVLPRQAPATLHLRIGQPAPADANYVVRIDGQELVRGPQPSSPRRAVVEVPLPQAILDAGTARDLTLSVTSVGSFGPHAYLLFAAVPPPFGRGGGGGLSPPVHSRRGAT